MELYIYNATLNNVPRQLLSVLHPDKVKDNGLNSTSVVGYMVNPSLPLSAANVVVNPHFIRLIHVIVATGIPKTPDFMAAIEEQQHGRISVIDQRVPYGREIQSQDIIGYFEILDGKIIQDYQANPEYQLISSNGVFQMEPEIEQELLIAAEE